MVVVTYRTEDDLDLIDMIRIQSIWMEMTSLFRGLETIAAAAAAEVLKKEKSIIINRALKKKRKKKRMHRKCKKKKTFGNANK